MLSKMADSRLPVRVILLVLTTAIWSGASAAQSPSSNEPVADIVKAWEEAAKGVTSYRLSRLQNYEVWEDGKYNVKTTHKFDRRYSPSGDATRGQTTEFDQGKSNREESIGHIRNASYTAVIRSRDGSNWRLTKTEFGANKNPLDEVDERLNWLRQDGYISFYRLLVDPRLKITRRVPTATGGQRLEFTLDASGPLPSPTALLDKETLLSQSGVRSGWVEISGPAFRIDAYDLERVFEKRLFHEIGTIEYIEDPKLPAPFAKKAVMEIPAYIRRNGTETRTRTVKTYEVEYPPSGDEGEYYFSHYGLPEPPGVTPPRKPTPTYVWLLLAAGAFGVLAVSFRWIARRRRATTSAV